MKTTLALFASAFIAISSAQAAIILQTQNYSNVSADDPGTALSLLWNKFDTGLGTLTGVKMTITSNLTGSFTVNNNAAGNASVYNSSSGFYFVFGAGAGQPAAIVPGAVSPISTSPSSGTFPGSSVAASSSETFTINGPISLYNSGTLDYFADASYFSAASPASFSTDLWRDFAATVTGGNFTLNSTDAVIGGTVTVLYEYTPTSAIPEPGTWAAAALLAGGAAYARWRKRKTA